MRLKRYSQYFMSINILNSLYFEFLLIKDKHVHSTSMNQRNNFEN